MKTTFCLSYRVKKHLVISIRHVLDPERNREQDSNRIGSHRCCCISTCRSKSFSNENFGLLTFPSKNSQSNDFLFFFRNKMPQNPVKISAKIFGKNFRKSRIKSLKFSMKFTLFIKENNRKIFLCGQRVTHICSEATPIPENLISATSGYELFPSPRTLNCYAPARK